ncbi:MAG TPA: AAA family ATPase [Candidatus Limnocylindrales bacterium]|jgi:DNA-binding SARP family transcriptional activator/tetratricopeptide (TPR) repeat protein
MQPPAAGLSVRLLGPVEVDVDGRRVAFDTRKAVALLAYLAVVQRPTSREGLAALLWPESDGADARNALRRTLSVLRAGLAGRGLVIDRSAVALEERSVEVDLSHFRSALARARGHGHPASEACPACIAALDEALAWDRGPFMEGFALRDSEAFDDWQAAEGEAHRRDLAGALERLARARAAERRWDLATDVTRRWLEVDPLHEPAHQLMISALARSGEVAGAIAQYRDLVRTLDRELGVAPLPETSELADAVRDGRLGPDPVAGEASQTRDTRPYGLASGGATSALPLTGRDADVARLVTAAASVRSDGRLLVIEGEAGIGKTRVAEAVAAAIRDAGGVVLEARTVAGESTIPFAVIAELIRSSSAEPGVADRITAMPSRWQADASRLSPLPGVTTLPPGPSSGTDPYGRLRLHESLSGALATLAEAPRGGLIWVDDVDRADVSSAEVIAYLARRLHDRRVSILLSGRFEAADAPESPPSLILALRDVDVRVHLERLRRSDVALLAESALGERATSDVVDALVAETEGLPLYLAEALAAPDSIGGSVPGGMLALLRGRIASVDEVGRQVLAGAAVIGRSFDLETVRAAAGRGEEETVDGLEALVRRGLIREVPSANGGDIHYDFTHGRLRDVAYEDTSLARRRLLHGRVADALARSGTGQPDATRWARIAAHATLAGRTEDAAAAHLRAGEGARDVYANPEAREHYEAALALGHPDAASIHEALGDLLTLMGDYARALGHYETAEAQGDAAREGSIEHRIGLVHARRGDLIHAERHLARAALLAGDGSQAGRILVDHGAIAIGLGDEAGARRLAEQAFDLSADQGDAIGMARAEALLGMLARRAGEPDEARRHLDAALVIVDAADRHATTDEPPDPGVRIATLNTLALLESDGGNGDAAETLMRDALDRCQRQGDRHRQAALENNLADLLHAQGREAESMEHLKRAVALFAEIGGRPGELEPEVWKLVEW